MQPPYSNLHGIWLPLVTPFRDDSLDETSLRRLLRHYATEPIDGLILAATTGEGLTLDEKEVATLVDVSADELEQNDQHIPRYLGLSGSHTKKIIKDLELTSSWAIDGYLIACPYYTRPSQQGLHEHFLALADNTSRPS
jgi:4-hydroxy-tetrahydrodipicolinate synthase